MVHPDRRRRGIATALTEWRLERAGPDAVVVAAIQSGNEGSFANARKWATQIFGALYVPVLEVERGAPLPANLELREPRDDAEWEQVAAGLDEYERGWNLRTPQAADAIRTRLARSCTSSRDASIRFGGSLRGGPAVARSLRAIGCTRRMARVAGHDSRNGTRAVHALAPGWIGQFPRFQRPGGIGSCAARSPASSRSTSIGKGAGGAGKAGGCRHWRWSRMRRRRCWCNQESVRSTTQRWLPRPEPWAVLRLAISGLMPSVRVHRDVPLSRSLGQRGAAGGLRRGLPTTPRIGGIASREAGVGWCHVRWPREQAGEREAVGVGDQVMFAAELAPVNRAGASLLAPQKRPQRGGVADSAGEIEAPDRREAGRAGARAVPETHRLVAIR